MVWSVDGFLSSWRCLLTKAWGTRSGLSFISVEETHHSDQVIAKGLFMTVLLVYAFATFRKWHCTRIKRKRENFILRVHLKLPRKLISVDNLSMDPSLMKWHCLGWMTLTFAGVHGLCILRVNIGDCFTQQTCVYHSDSVMDTVILPSGPQIFGGKASQI